VNLYKFHNEPEILKGYDAFMKVFEAEHKKMLAGIINMLKIFNIPDTSKFLKNLESATNALVPYLNSSDMGDYFEVISELEGVLEDKLEETGISRDDLYDVYDEEISALTKALVPYLTLYDNI